MTLINIVEHNNIEFLISNEPICILNETHITFSSTSRNISIDQLSNEFLNILIDTIEHIIIKNKKEIKFLIAGAPVMVFDINGISLCNIQPKTSFDQDCLNAIIKKYLEAIK